MADQHLEGVVSISKSNAHRGATTLYRLYGQDDALLYVGITENLTNRMSGHARFKRWWGDVASVTVEVFPTWAEAHTAEVEAIGAEWPRHNVRHTPAAEYARSVRAARLEYLTEALASLPSP